MGFKVYINTTVSANNIPRIDVIAVLNVTVGKETRLEIDTSDADVGDAVTLTLESDLPTGATFNGISLLKWTPVNTDPVNIT